MGVVREQMTEAKDAFARVVRNRDLRRVNLALTGSVVGDWAYNIAISVWAYQQDGATGVGVFAVVRYVLLALCAPAASALGDRYPRKLVMIASDVVRAVLVGAGAALLAVDAPSLTVYALALVISVIGTAFRPAQAALLPSLANDPSELTNANVVASTVESVGFFLGPAIAALLLAATNIWVVLLFDAATFVWSATILLGVGVARTVDPAADTADGTATPDHTDADDADDAADSTGILQGFATIARDRDLRLICLLISAQTVVAGSALVFEVAIVFDLLGRGESTVGVVNAVLGVGGLVGGVLVAAMATRGRMATQFGVGVLGWALPLLLIAVQPSLVTVLLAQAIIGISNSMVDINAYTIVQRVAPEPVLARVFGALESMCIAGMAIGSLAAPILIAVVDLRWALAIVACGVSAVSVVAMRRLADIDHRVLAPPTLRLVRSVPMLAVLGRLAQERLATALVPRHVVPGEEIIREGDEGDRFWIVERGRVAVTSNGRDLGRLGPGDSFGELALLRDAPRAATVTAIEDGTVFGLERDEFLAAVTNDESAVGVADNVVNRYLGLA